MAEQETKKPVPSKIGRYRIFSKLAAGGMATVYLARSENEAGFEKIVALKVIHDHLAGEKSFVDMFLDEARIAANINHPNVCTVFDFGVDKGVYYLAMEYLLGEPLGRIIRTIAKRQKKEEVKELPWYLARVMADACEGLHAAHELTDATGKHLGVVHRDVSPENIIVTYDGAVKLVDFGVAKAAQRIHETKVNKIKGKFAYVSPEQVQNMDLDRRTDLWGVGVCLWESLTLRRLFRRESDAATLLAVVHDEIPPPSMLRGWVPPELDEIVLRALSREPEERYPSARAMGHALRTFLVQSGATLGSAELGEWMDALFPDEKLKRVDRLRRAQQGKVSGSLAPAGDESSVTDGTMPSVSMHMSPGEVPAAATGVPLSDIVKAVNLGAPPLAPAVVGLLAMDVCEHLQKKPAKIAPEQIRISPEGRITLVPPFDEARESDAVRSVIASLKLVTGDELSPITRLLDAGEFRSPSELSHALEAELDPIARGEARKQLVKRVQGELPIQARTTTRPRRPTPIAVGDPLAIGGPSPVVHTAWDDDVLDDTELMRGVKRGGGFFKLVLVLLVLGAVAIAGIAVFKPAMMNELLISAGLRDAPEPEPEPEPIPEPDPTGSVVLRVATEGAEVFRFVGRAPVSIEDLAVRETHQVLAAVEERPFLRHEVRSTDGWNAEDPARLELALSVPEEEVDASEREPAEPSDDSRRGTLRIVTDPVGAKIFHLVGTAPEVTFDDLPMDEPFEALIVAPGHEPHREIVTASQWQGERIERDVTLEESSRSSSRRRRREGMSTRMSSMDDDDFTLGE